MGNNRIEMVFILDRSGSMSGLEADTIGGFNAMIEKQRQAEGEAVVTTVLFDDRYELLHDRVDLRAVAPVTEKEYYVRGSTALLDAVGETIKKIDRAQKSTAAEYRADKVVVVITTDGMENASRRYRYSDVKQLVEHQQAEHGWEFLFLGANIDAAETAGRVGIQPKCAANFHADSRGLSVNYEAVAGAISHLRAKKSLPDDWKASIDIDFHSR